MRFLGVLLQPLNLVMSANKLYLIRCILQIIENEGNKDDLFQHPPKQGFLTISNALQWRLQYSRAIEQAGKVAGIYRINP